MLVILWMSFLPNKFDHWPCVLASSPCGLLWFFCGIPSLPHHHRLGPVDYHVSWPRVGGSELWSISILAICNDVHLLQAIFGRTPPAAADCLQNRAGSFEKFASYILWERRIRLAKKTRFFKERFLHKKPFLMSSILFGQRFFKEWMRRRCGIWLMIYALTGAPQSLVYRVALLGRAPSSSMAGHPRPFSTCVCPVKNSERPWKCMQMTSPGHKASIITGLHMLPAHTRPLFSRRLKTWFCTVFPAPNEQVWVEFKCGLVSRVPNVLIHWALGCGRTGRWRKNNLATAKQHRVCSKMFGLVSWALPGAVDHMPGHKSNASLHGVNMVVQTIG